MIHIAICDNKRSARREATAFCHRFFRGREIRYRLREYADSRELLLEDWPDILLMDAKLDGISGVCVKEIFERKQADTRILFLASATARMSEAFGRNVYGFLPKPVRYPQFAERMQVIVADIEQEKGYVYCQTDGLIERIYFKDIRYIEANGRYTRVYVYGDGAVRDSKLGIRQWRGLLENREFYLQRRKYLVNSIYEMGKVLQ